MPDSLIVARAIHFASALTVLGGVVFLAVVAEPAFRRADALASTALAGLRRRIRGLVAAGLALAVASGAVWLVLLAAAIVATSWDGALRNGTTWVVLTTTQFGHVSLLRAAAAALLAIVLAWRGTERAPARRPTARNAILIALAAVLVAGLAATGHSGDGSGTKGAVQLINDGVHLLVAGVWLGGLAPLALLLATTTRGPVEARTPAAVSLATAASISDCDSSLVSRPASPGAPGAG